MYVKSDDSSHKYRYHNYIVYFSNKHTCDHCQNLKSEQKNLRRVYTISVPLKSSLKCFRPCISQFYSLIDFGGVFRLLNKKTNVLSIFKKTFRYINSHFDKALIVFSSKQVGVSIYMYAETVSHSGKLLTVKYQNSRRTFIYIVLLSIWTT